MRWLPRLTWRSTASVRPPRDDSASTLRRFAQDILDSSARRSAVLARAARSRKLRRMTSTTRRLPGSSGRRCCRVRSSQTSVQRCTRPSRSSRRSSSASTPALAPSSTCQSATPPAHGRLFRPQPSCRARAMRSMKRPITSGSHSAPSSQNSGAHSARKSGARISFRCIARLAKKASASPTRSVPSCAPGPPTTGWRISLTWMRA